MRSLSPTLESPRESNGLGIAAFVVSLVGLLGTGGLLCPLGLILGLVALSKRPRGLAIAGVVLGFLGTCGGVLVFLFAGAAVLAAIGIVAVAVVLSEPQKFEVTGDMAVIAAAVENERGRAGQLPLDLSGLQLPAAVTIDPWGLPYEYVLAADMKEFDLVSLGADGLADTLDDVSFKNLDKLWDTQGTVRISTSAEKGRVRIKVGDREIDVDGETGEVQVTNEPDPKASESSERGPG